uniref:hypothetical protein n=1 Tax=Clostridium sp. NkU-1 TaxID=1095009 RepID=UPI0006D2719E
MNTVKMMFTSLSLSLFSTLLLKVYLDIFLVKKSRYVRLVGWSLFFLWQFGINTKVVFFSSGNKPDDIINDNFDSWYYFL